MSLETTRFIKCDGMSRKHPEKSCSQHAEVLHGRIRHARHLLKQSGWKRVRRGQSMVDLCNWCASKAKFGAPPPHKGGV
jgi:hypothetical protein